MIKVSLAIISLLLVSSCAEVKQPSCWAKIEIGKRVYDQPVYEMRKGFYENEYLVGDAFKYTWLERSQFKNLSECDAKFGK